MISFLIGLVIALAVALARLSSNMVLTNVARFYISVIRGTPLLVQLFIVFYALPELGVKIDPFPAAIIAFSLNVGGYAAEIIRSAIQSIPKGQWEAAETIGLNYVGALRRIILPQATRVAVPPLSNTLISLVKDTSLASTILAPSYFGKPRSSPRRRSNSSLSTAPPRCTTGSSAWCCPSAKAALNAGWKGMWRDDREPRDGRGRT